ncbi:MAG: 16S rRNA (guanine(527)-N(7))-methyltransferase RsmG [Nitrospirota bacterium]|nr:16S rRNA (guanine(527)-N(7))-methyltransferase RsmG [Nitrospirota bacterium]
MKNEELLKKGLNEIGLSCSAQQAAAFMTYLSELKKWGRVHNLSSLKTDNDIIIKHFIDSLLYLKVVPEGSLKMADAGSGAGFPGIPIKIMRPETDITLIEPARKKAVFLRHMIRLLKLEAISVLEQRMEYLGKDHEKAFDIIVSRATFDISEFLRLACPYIAKDGRLIASKGPKVSEEVKALQAMPSPPGSVKELHRFSLPFITAERNLVVLQCKSGQE